MNILVIGGAGYIGTHTSIEILQNGHYVIILDNLVNSKEEAIKRIEKITSKQVVFYKTDLLDATSIDQIFSKEKIDGIGNQKIQTDTKFFLNIF